MAVIPEFYRGRSILVTGGTGFMGKVLVEKLLRSCSGLDAIFILVRSQRNQTAQERLQEMINTKLFDWLRKNQSDRFRKLIPIHGDIMKPELGLSKEDQQILCDNVSIVFHSAATVKFDEALKMSVGMNLIGTKKLLELCQRMVKLEAVVHVSTAYCNCNRYETSEKMYPPPANPEMIMQMVELLDERLLDAITPEILNDLPNTYTFTKALAEQLVMEEGGRLPIAIVRPSIVTAAWKEPLPGWVDNMNGATGIIAGAGKGVLRSIFCHKDSIVDLIPVDVAINLLITVAWYTATVRTNDVVVYNCTSGTTNPILWRDIEKFGHQSIIKNPFNDVIWYPAGNFKRSKIAHQFSVVAFHFIPAYMFDFFAWARGKKPIMVGIQRKLKRAISYLEYFLTREFKFSNENTVKLLQNMETEDKALFDFDIRSLDWNKYFHNYVLGTRNYVLKEDISTLPKARQHLRRMLWLHRFTQLMLVAAFWKLFMMRSETIRKTFQYIFLFILQGFNSIAIKFPQISF